MAAAHKWCSLVFVHKIDGILKIQCKIKTKEGRWNVLFHYEPRFTDSGDRVILSEKLEDNQAAAEWGLHSEYAPTGDQPQAIEKLVKGFQEGNQFETLLGVTGSGKTFTMANVIAALNKPTLIISHNKTLAAQFYGEFKEFFPENAVEYFVSYYET